MKIFKNRSFSLVFSIISSVPPCSFCARILNFLFKNTVFCSLIVGCVWDYIFDRPNPPKSRPKASKSSPRAPKRSSKVHSEFDPAPSWPPKSLSWPLKSPSWPLESLSWIPKSNLLPSKVDV